MKDERSKRDERTEKGYKERRKKKERERERKKKRKSLNSNKIFLGNKT